MRNRVLCLGTVGLARASTSSMLLSSLAGGSRGPWRGSICRLLYGHSGGLFGRQPAGQQQGQHRQDGEQR